MKQRFFAAALMLTVATPFFAKDAFAQGTTPTTPETVTDGSSELSGDKADEIITNRRLRASTGSLSRWSINSSWAYDAGSIEKPFDVERPNITAGSDVQALQALSGSIGVRYRLTDTESISFSTGLAMVAPFHSSIDDDAPSKAEYDKTARKLNIDNPGIGITKIYKVAGIQNVSALDLTYYTTEFFKNNEVKGKINFAQQMIYDVGQSGFSFGALFQLNYFHRAADDKGGVDLTPYQPSHGIGLYPMAEYVINDTFNLRTIAGALVYQNNANQDNMTFHKLKIYQSIGLGISVTRDIFLYPNIQFLPENIRGDLTNIGMSANINIF